MGKVSIATATGDRHSGHLPAAPFAKTQSRDALEVSLRTLCEDTALTSFVIKAFSFILILYGIVNRFRAMIAFCDQMITEALDSTSKARTTDLNLIHAYSDHSQSECPFCISLNTLHQYQMQQNDIHFRQWLKQVMGEAPSLTATLHGATCGNLLCTYQI